MSLCQRLPRHAPPPGHAQMLSCFPAAVCRVLTRTRVSAARGRVRGVFSFARRSPAVAPDALAPRVVGCGQNSKQNGKLIFSRRLYAAGRRFTRPMLCR